ncbi:MAG: hypothetical protein Q7T74_02645, partial [Candidatus Saccharibacteria bacterium]|nr:hypothetical protein [Candidatus Saccharibacteria bacterium]
MAIIFLLLFVLVPVGVSASAISRSYRIDGSPSKGNLVSLDASQSGVGHLANITNSSDLLGAVVGQDDSLLVIDPTDGTVEVAIGGTAPVLVSTVNGDIKVGDLISVSPIIGVGMKAEEGLPVIGRAQTAFTAQSTTGTSRQITDKNGKTKNVQMGFVSVEIKINTSPEGTAPINTLQKIVKGITGRVISTVRI